MASFTAELHVGGYVIPLIRCTYGTHQEIDLRGRPIAKVRRSNLDNEADVPHHQVLDHWAHEALLRQEAFIYVRDADTGRVLETLHLKAAYCTRYAEQFVSGDVGSGAYRCIFTLADPDGWTLHAGTPANAAATQPAAGEHGAAPVAMAIVSQATAILTGGRGPSGFGDTKGFYSGRPYDPAGAGGPIQDLDWRQAQIEDVGIATVRKHVERFGRIIANEKMLARLDSIAAGTLASTDFDKRFYTHELREYERYRNVGIADGANPSYEVWNDTHTATLEEYKLNEEAEPLYHPNIPEIDFFTEL